VKLPHVSVSLLSQQNLKGFSSGGAKLLRQAVYYYEREQAV
jgi:hypothetical protein